MPDQNNSMHAAALEAELDLLRKAQNQVQDEHKIISQKLEEQELVIESKDESINNLNLKVARLISDGEMKNQVINTLQKNTDASTANEIENYKRIIEDLQNQLLEEKQDKARITKERDNLRDLLSEKAAEKLRLTQRIDKLVQEIDALRVELKDAKADVLTNKVEETLEIIRLGCRSSRCFSFIRREVDIPSGHIEIKTTLEKLVSDHKLTRSGCTKKFFDAFPEFKQFTSIQTSALKRLKCIIVTDVYKQIDSRLDVFETKDDKKFQQDLLNLDCRNRDINDLAEDFLNEYPNYKRYKSFFGRFFGF